MQEQALLDDNQTKPVPIPNEWTREGWQYRVIKRQGLAVIAEKTRQGSDRISYEVAYSELKSPLNSRPGCSGRFGNRTLQATTGVREAGHA